MAHGFALFVPGLLLLGCAAPVGGTDVFTSGTESASSGSASATGSTGASTETSATTTESSGSTTTGGQACVCAPGTDLIYVLGDDGELWSYDPQANEFAMVADITCGTQTQAFSMGVNRAGVAHVLFVESGGLSTVDINDPVGCGESGFTPGQGGFSLFGMSFSSASANDPCEKLYLHSYSGSGPFAEGEGLGALGVFDPASNEVQTIGPIDFDGGELAGTGNGRLFGFAGNDPAKLVEYDKTTAQEIQRLVLDGFSKTNASALAFWGGDFYFFTEAQPPQCAPCLEQACPSAWDMCQQDQVCTDHYNCVLELKDFTDECGGGLSPEMMDCMQNACGEACFPNKNTIVSQVTRLDFDDSEGNGQVLTTVNALAPIRVVGAGASTCVPYNPP